MFKEVEDLGLPGPEIVEAGMRGRFIVIWRSPLQYSLHQKKSEGAWISRSSKQKYRMTARGKAFLAKEKRYLKA